MYKEGETRVQKFSALVSLDRLICRDDKDAKLFSGLLLTTKRLYETSVDLL